MQMDAVEWLHYAGSAKAETPLWQLLERVNRDTANDRRRRLMLLGQLLQTIPSSTGWLMNDEKFALLQTFCPGEDYCYSVKQAAASWHAPFPIFVQGGGTSYSVAGYQVNGLDELELKISQFPAGTSFAWLQMGYEAMPVMQAVRARANAVLERHQMKLVSTRR